MSTLNVNEIQHSSGAGSNISLNNQGNVQVRGLNGSGVTNLSRNPALRFWQRGSGPENVTNSTADAYLADGWAVRGTAATGGNATQQRVTEDGVTKIRITTNGYTSYGSLRQILEAQDIQPYAGMEMCLSVYANAQPNAAVNYSNSSDDVVVLIASSPMTQVGTSNRYYVTFTIPTDTQIASQATARGMATTFRFNGGEDPLTNGSYDFWNIQLEPGNYPMPFTVPNATDDLTRCQRYFQICVASGVVCNCASTGETTARGTVPINTAMRISTPSTESDQIFFIDRSGGADQIENLNGISYADVGMCRLQYNRISSTANTYRRISKAANSVAGTSSDTLSISAEF